MFDIPTFIFLSVIMVAFGYAAGNAHNFNKWKLALLALILIPIFNEFNFGKAHFLTMIGAFLVGYWLPYVYMLKSFGEAISDAINAFRYRDAWKEIQRKEAEIEKLRKEYEEFINQKNEKRREQEHQKRKQQSKDYRQSQPDNKRSSNKQGSQQQNSQSSGSSTKDKYLIILGLDPRGNHSQSDIKKSFREMTKIYHPDRHEHKNDEELTKKMNKKFQEINEANEWLKRWL